MIVLAPGVAKEDIPLLDPLRPPNALCPKLLPKVASLFDADEPPPNTDLLELPPRAPKPLPTELAVFDGDAKLVSPLPLGVEANGDFELELPRPPNGEADEVAKLPNPEALNFSSLV